MSCSSASSWFSLCSFGKSRRCSGSYGKSSISHVNAHSCLSPENPSSATADEDAPPENADRSKLQNPRPFTAAVAGKRTQVPDSTDWVASSLTRRFGLGAGLAWVGFLAFGVITEQVKTRTEVFLEKQGTRDVVGAEEVVLPSGVRYVEETIGGGASPRRGDLVVVDVEGRAGGDEVPFVSKRSVAFVVGAKPYRGGMCRGLEEAIESMRAGGRRRVTVPPELGFGDNRTLHYDVQLQRVSVAPS